MKNKITINIAFDIDEVMVNFIHPVTKIIKNRGYKLTKIESFDLTKHITPDISKNKLHKILEIVYKDPDCVPIYNKAAELCTRLHVKTNDPILFITDRPIQWATQTHQLVKRFCRVPYIIAFANDFGKLPFLNDVMYFVEDRKKTAMQLAENGKTVFIPKRDWNESIRTDFEFLDSIVYIQNIDELIENVNLFVK